jgi:uncharacterized protein (DUF1800 family)
VHEVRGHRDFIIGSSSWATMASDPALVAHLLRRMTFGPRPGEIDRYIDLEAADIVRSLLDAAPIQPEPPGLGTDDDYGILLRWWLAVMASPDAGLHERMVWFWHGHLTSSLDQADPRQMYRQHELLRRHALGNFRTMMQEITIDPAMLWWLDGAGSTAEAPNENYAREVMELFTLGRGNYTEADVRAGAVAFSGWWVDDDGEPQYDDSSGPQSSVDLRGGQVSSAGDAIDVLCDHPACAPFVAGKVHSALTGAPPDDARRAELASVFVQSGLEIGPLVEAIVTHESFLDRSAPRPRTPVEWWLAVQHLFATDLEEWSLDQLGQLPFSPPNVAGWPGHDRWISAGATFTKAQIAMDYAWDVSTLGDDDPVGEVLWRAGLIEVSDATRAVLDEAAQSIESRRERATVLHALVTMTPEFSLA